MSSFPLIRAAAAVPFLKWMQADGRPIDEALRSIDLALPPWEQPTRPIALHNALRLVRNLTDQEGPDLGFRVVSGASVAEIGNLGRAMLSAQTPRQALQKSAAAMPFHCSHEWILLEPVAGGVVLREQMMLDLDQALRHAEQQYVVAIIRALCLATGYRGEPIERIEIVPHPAAGLSALHVGAGVSVRPSASTALVVFVPDRVLDRPFRLTAPSGVFGVPDWQILTGFDQFCETARIYVETMLDSGSPSIGRFVAASGMSRRTLQRRLAEEGRTFSTLLEEVRRDIALDRLIRGTEPIGQISFELGYSNPPAFHRAVRRWAGVSPTEIRRKAHSDGAGLDEVAHAGWARHSNAPTGGKGGDAIRQ